MVAWLDGGQETPSVHGYSPSLYRNEAQISMSREARLDLPCRLLLLGCRGLCFLC